MASRASRKTKPGPPPTPPSRPKSPRWGYGVFAACVAGCAVMIVGRWPVVGPGLLAAAVPRAALVGVLLLTAAALGAAILRLAGITALPRPLGMLVATALGVGAYSLLLLTAGLAGVLGRPTLYLLPTASTAIGAVPLWRLWRRSHKLDVERVVTTRWTWALVATIPFLAVAVAAVQVPPGLLWSGSMNPQRADPQSDGDSAATQGGPAASHPCEDLEGRGYDALEYHLQVPREYLSAGGVRFLPHNVYSNFPANAEMWFMLLLGQTDPPQAAVKLIQTFNLVLALLAVATIYVTARLRGAGGEADAGGGPLAALAVATVPMVVTVAVVPYVEPMMLFFFAAALGMLRHFQLSADAPMGGSRPIGNQAVVIGLLLGLGCGCKYLAIPFMALPLLAGYLLTGGLTRLPAARKFRLAMLMVAGAGIAFAPWLIKTTALSGGNPVYPLMWNSLDGGDWAAADAARWNAAHLPHMDVGERLQRAWWHFFAHPSMAYAAGWSGTQAVHCSALYGPWLWLLCWPIFFTRRRCRWDWMLLITALAQFAFWIAVSHVPGRFILPAVLPLALLVGRSMAAMRPAIRGILLVVLLTLAAVSAVQLLMRFEHDTFKGATYCFEPAESLFMSAVAPWGPMNQRLEQAGAAVDGTPMLWLVGDAKPLYYRYPVRYNVVFSHDHMADLLETLDADAMRDKLREMGIRFVLVDWDEIDRLRGSYGFRAVYTPAKLAGLGRRIPLRPEGDTPELQYRYWLLDLSIPPTTQPTTREAASQPRTQP